MARGAGRRHRNGRGMGARPTCMHGCKPTKTPMLRKVHEVVNETLIPAIMAPSDYTGNGFQVAQDFHSSHPTIAVHTYTVQILLTWGTSCILGMEPWQLYSRIAEVTICLQEFGTLARDTNRGKSLGVLFHLDADMLHKLKKLRDYPEVESVRFFAKHIPCDCLEERKKEVKSSIAKVGQCCAEGCSNMQKDKKLLVCAGCHWAKYCSKECQKGDWKNHKHCCKAIQRSTKQRAEAVESNDAGVLKTARDELLLMSALESELDKMRERGEDPAALLEDLRAREAEERMLLEDPTALLEDLRAIQSEERSSVTPFMEEISRT